MAGDALVPRSAPWGREETAFYPTELPGDGFLRLLRALGRFLVTTCPRNALTPDPAQPALRTPPPIFCEACRELADALGLEEET